MDINEYICKLNAQSLMLEKIMYFAKKWNETELPDGEEGE